MKKRKLVVCIYSVLILTLLVSCKKVIFNGSDDPLPTTPATPTTAAAKNPDEGKTPEQVPTKDPVQATSTPSPTAATAVTEAPVATSTPVPTSTTTPAPEPTPTQGPITVSEAKAVLLGEIGAGYEAEYTGDAKTGGAEYYLFTVSDSAHTYTPQIAVNANSKEIFYYYSQDELAEFANFPPDNLESAGGEDGKGDGNEGENAFTSQSAVDLLMGLTAAELGLPAKLSEYTILVDEWTTMVYGLECYCVNAYAELENRKQLMGVYFVAVDGSAAYRSDMGDFVLIY